MTPPEPTPEPAPASLAKPRVYVETSVIGVLTAWPSKVDRVQEMQEHTHDWWDHHREKFTLYVSDHVAKECGHGDTVAAQERLIVVSQLSKLPPTIASDDLGDKLIRANALPVKAAEDALHIAVAAVYNLEYLLTWNMRHINNTQMLPVIARVCTANGFRAPRIVTPRQLMEEMP